MKECLRKEAKRTGGQIAFTFSSEEVRLYKMKKGQKYRITIQKITEDE